MRVLQEEVLKRKNINIKENQYAIDLLTLDNKCLGVWLRMKREYMLYYQR